jgi:hypothetical protein
MLLLIKVLLWIELFRLMITTTRVLKEQFSHLEQTAML